ncbi:DNA polymerase III subunit beta [candidate division WOR-3 bacterium]|nr:DNA polymerase III subunit beta [candidate division WOR-3 bacterium]
MKVKFNRKNLASMLSLVHPIVPEKSSIPVYSNILLEVKAGRIYITGQDTEMAVTAIGDAEIEEEGDITVPGRKIYDIVRELPDEEVNFKSGENSVSIKCGRGSYRLQSIPRADYPEVIAVKEGERVTIDGALLKRVIDLSIFAIPHDSYSSVPQGALLQIGSNYLRMVATDGHRLAYVEKKGEVGSEKSVILSEKTARLASKLTGSIEIRIEEQVIGFYTENTVLVSRLVEGDYPDYEDVIPKDNDRIIIMNREAFLGALRRANVISDPLTRMVRLRISEGKLSVGTVSEVGESNEDLECRYEGEEFDVGYNIIYLSEVVSRIGTENIKIMLKDGVHAGVFLPETKTEGEEVVYLLMPVVL